MPSVRLQAYDALALEARDLLARFGPGALAGEALKLMREMADLVPVRRPRLRRPVVRDIPREGIE